MDRKWDPWAQMGMSVASRGNKENVSQSVVRDDFMKTAEPIKQKVKSYNSSYSEYIKEKAALLLASAHENINISPFDDVWMTDNWKRVTDITLLPVASVGAEIQVRKYGHFIYGHKGEHLYLAVPGKHTENEWPDRGQSGFMMWQPIRNSGEYGYWCAVIAWKMGIITEIS